MMLGSPCSPCCVSCDSLVSRLPFEVVAEITGMATDISPNPQSCNEELREIEPFSYWFSLAAETAFTATLTLRPFVVSGGIWEINFAESFGDFLSGDSIEVELACSESGGQLLVGSGVGASLRGTSFAGAAAIFSNEELSLFSALESPGVISFSMQTDSINGCVGFASLQVLWPGLNPLP